MINTTRATSALARRSSIKDEMIFSLSRLAVCQVGRLNPLEADWTLHKQPATPGIGLSEPLDKKVQRRRQNRCNEGAYTGTEVSIVQWRTVRIRPDCNSFRVLYEGLFLLLG